jgi:hypothetical protein
MEMKNNENEKEPLKEKENLIKKITISRNGNKNV